MMLLYAHPALQDSKSGIRVSRIEGSNPSLSASRVGLFAQTPGLAPLNLHAKAVNLRQADDDLLDFRPLIDIDVEF